MESLGLLLISGREVALSIEDRNETSPIFRLGKGSIKVGKKVELVWSVSFHLVDEGLGIGVDDFVH
ncbi:MAG: hypothetical protein LBU27_03560 [Candidatus Peribacteria bacterium]|nr:hypothetical protein [Candidatus Peribacteria bacterium]